MCRQSEEDITDVRIGSQAMKLEKYLRFIVVMCGKEKPKNSSRTDTTYAHYVHLRAVYESYLYHFIHVSCSLLLCFFFFLRPSTVFDDVTHPPFAFILRYFLL